LLRGVWKLKVSKEKIPLNDGSFVYYVKILEFRDEHQWEIMGKKVEQLVKEQKGRTKVF
jgi:hypothetical protein